MKNTSRETANTRFLQTAPEQGMKACREGGRDNNKWLSNIWWCYPDRPFHYFRALESVDRRIGTLQNFYLSQNTDFNAITLWKCSVRSLSVGAESSQLLFVWLVELDSAPINKARQAGSSRGSSKRIALWTKNTFWHTVHVLLLTAHRMSSDLISLYLYVFSNVLGVGQVRCQLLKWPRVKPGSCQTNRAKKCQYYTLWQYFKNRAKMSSLY